MIDSGGLKYLVIDNKPALRVKGMSVHTERTGRYFLCNLNSISFEKDEPGKNRSLRSNSTLLDMLGELIFILNIF